MVFGIREISMETLMGATAGLIGGYFIFGDGKEMLMGLLGGGPEGPPPGSPEEEMMMAGGPESVGLEGPAGAVAGATGREWGRGDWNRGRGWGRWGQGWRGHGWGRSNWWSRYYPRYNRNWWSRYYYPWYGRRHRW